MRCIFNDPEIFLMIEKTFSLMRNIGGKSRNILKDQEKFFIGQQFFIGWEFFGRLRINFVYLKFFCWSRIFFVNRELVCRSRIYLTVENFFFVNRELFCQSSWSAGVFVPKYDHMGQHMTLKKMADCKGVLCTGQQPFLK